MVEQANHIVSHLGHDAHIMRLTALAVATSIHRDNSIACVKEGIRIFGQPRESAREALKQDYRFTLSLVKVGEPNAIGIEFTGSVVPAGSVAASLLPPVASRRRQSRKQDGGSEVP